MKKQIYRFFAVASIFIILASIWHVKSNPHDYKECAKAAQIAALNDIELNTAIDPKYKASQSQKNQTKIDNQIKCDDLGAQWGMTDIAFLGYIAGLLGLVFLGVTVYETQSAAQSAKDTLAIAAMTSERELQPYLTAFDIDIDGIEGSIPVMEEGFVMVHASFFLKNNGKIPAHISSVRQRARIFDIGVVPSWQAKIVDIGITGQTVCIAPNSKEVIRLYFKFTIIGDNIPKSIIFSDILITNNTVITYDDDFSFMIERRKTIEIIHSGKFERNSDTANSLSIPTRVHIPYLYSGDVHESKRNEVHNENEWAKHQDKS